MKQYFSQVVNDCPTTTQVLIVNKAKNSKNTRAQSDFQQRHYQIHPVRTEKAAYSNEFIMKNQYWTLSYEFSIFNPNSFISLCQGAKEEVLNKKGFSNDFRFSEIVFCTLHFVFPRRKSSFQVCSNIWPFRKSPEEVGKLLKKIFAIPSNLKSFALCPIWKKQKKNFLFFPTWLIGFVINLSFPLPTFCNENLCRAKAIKELNQERDSVIG